MVYGLLALRLFGGDTEQCWFFPSSLCHTEVVWWLEKGIGRCDYSSLQSTLAENERCLDYCPSAVCVFTFARFPFNRCRFLQISEAGLAISVCKLKADGEDKSFLACFELDVFSNTSAVLSVAVVPALSASLLFGV